MADLLQAQYSSVFSDPAAEGLDSEASDVHPADSHLSDIPITEKDMAEAMRESTKSFTESINCVSRSMTDLGSGISRSIELLAQALLMQTKQPINQNQFYQHPPNNMYSQMLNSPLLPPHSTRGNENNK